MLTRKKHQALQKRQRHNRRLMICNKVSRLRNPYRTYRITDSFYLNDEMLNKHSSPVDIFSAIFDWNEILSAEADSSNITFELNPVSNKETVPPEYLVERFMSFGSQFYYELAQAIKQAMEMKPVENIESGKRSQYYGGRALSLIGQRLGGNTVMKRIVISKQLCRDLGFTEDMMMMEAVKFGRLPIAFEEEGQKVAEICLGYIKMIVMFNKFVQEQNLQHLQQFLQSARSPLQCRITTSNKVQFQQSQLTGFNTVEAIFVSPTCMLFNFDKLELCEPEKDMNSPTTLESRSEIQTQELETLHKIKLTEIPQSELSFYQSKICNYRDK